MQPSAIITLSLPSSLCDYCGRAIHEKNAPLKIKVTRLHAASDPWRPSGVAETTRDYTRCPNCGAIFEALLHAIPVQTEDFTCPRCKEPEHLDYSIVPTEKHDDSAPEAYDFSATVSCPKCHRQRTITKTLTRLATIREVTVGAIDICAEQAV